MVNIVLEALQSGLLIQQCVKMACSITTQKLVCRKEKGIVFSEHVLFCLQGNHLPCDWWHEGEG